MIAVTRTPKNASLAGKTLEDNGQLRGLDPADAFFNLLLEEHGQVTCMPFMMTEKDVQTLLRAPWVDIASDGSSLAIEGVLGDGHPHPRSFVPQHARAFPEINMEKRAIGPMVRREQSGAIDIPVERRQPCCVLDHKFLVPGFLSRHRLTM